MQWDIFCKVIDNFGDIGVCWRLVCGLAAHGHTCRLWVDDPSALSWMAPHLGVDGMGHAGVEVLPWLALNTDWPDHLQPADVVVEAFACELPDIFIARMHRPIPPVWINLEYFSAESFVERSHGLPSPVMHGPGRGLRKHFFFPGMTERTGGLMRPMQSYVVNSFQNREDWRQAVLASHGLQWQANERVVNVFCYEHAPLHAWLNVLHHASFSTCHVLLMPGAAQILGSSWIANLASPTLLKLHAMPFMSQPRFDELLAVADLNIVRGEDSATSALWAGRPHIWHIYFQHDFAHSPKLEAFMNHWMQAWPEMLREDVKQLWRAFNGLAAPDQMKRMITLWQGDNWAKWQSLSLFSGQKQAQNSDLISRLLVFVDGLSI